MKAAIYARISLDRHEGEGVARQLADCRAEAKRRGWSATEYVDNDLSAFRGHHRPEWERLLTDLEAGAVDAVIAYHPDRLYRRLADLERLIAAIDANSVTVVTIRAGDIDLSTATGRMIARIIGAVASAESERTGERVARAKRARAAEGRPAGGGRRPFGLTADRLGIEPDEAAQLRLVASAVLAGGSIGDQVRRLNDEGWRTTSGNLWTAAGLRRVITSPHVAGLRAYKGEIVADAVTPPIIDRDDWDALRLGALSRKRGRPPTDRHLLTGLLRCGACGLPMYAQRTKGDAFAYQCTIGASIHGRGCSRSIVAAGLDEVVMDAVDGFLRDARLHETVAATEPRTAAPAADSEVGALERRRTVLTQRWAAGEIPDDEYEAGRQVIVDRLAQLSRPAAGPSMPAVMAMLPVEWRDEPVKVRREIIAVVARTPLEVGPGIVTGARVPVSERVRVEARWSP